MHSNLGYALYSLGKHEEAIASYRRALELKPNYAEAYSNLGNILKGLGNYKEAIAHFHRALELKPDLAEAHNNLGNVLKYLGKNEEAVASYYRALELKPDFVEVYNNLGNIFMVLGKNEEAVASFQRALKLNPNYAEVYKSLGKVLKNLGRHEEAVASFLTAIKLDDNISTRGALLGQLALICDWGQTGEAILNDIKSHGFGSKPNDVSEPFNFLSLIDDAGFHRSASEAYASVNYKSNPSLGPFLNRGNADRIRIGYYSSDFYNHATMYLMAELFEQHDRSKYEIHVFSYGLVKKDGMRTRLINSVEFFHDVRTKGDAEIAVSVSIIRN